MSETKFEQCHHYNIKGSCSKCRQEQHTSEITRLQTALNTATEALELVRDIAHGSTTANSLPNIHRIAATALADIAKRKDSQ